MMTKVKAGMNFPRRAIEVLRALNASERKLRFTEVTDRLNLYNRTASAALAWLTQRELAVRVVVQEAVPRHTEYGITDKGRDLINAMEPVEKWRRRWG